jgi:hypothetical protein
VNRESFSRFPFLANAMAVEHLSHPTRGAVSRLSLVAIGDRAMAVKTTEHSGLIGSDEVDGTDVYGADGKSIGSIERIMVGKHDGKVAYAVLSFGGFLGIGDDHYPLPWQELTYDTELGGYRVSLTREKLEGAPKYSGVDWDWEDRNRARAVSDYYGSAYMGY